MGWLRTQSVYFWLALGFFTRLPIPPGTPFSPALLNHASRYFSLVGLLVGALGAGSLLASGWLLPTPVAVLLSMAVTVLLTGAFHEDGLADMADGLGGGLTRERKLAIMKDSRLGSYGALALLFALLLKWSSLLSLAELDLDQAALALIIMHPLSRALAGSLIFDMAYVREQDGKSKPLAEQQSHADLAILLLLGALPLLWLPPLLAASLLLGLGLLRLLAKAGLNRQLGGYTGDCLGGVQQLAELAGYLILLVWNTGGYD